MKNFLFSLFVLVSVSAWSQNESVKSMVPYVVLHHSGSTHISAFKLDGQFHGKYLEFDENGRMKPSAYYNRLVDVMEEVMKFTWLTRGHAQYLVDR